MMDDHVVTDSVYNPEVGEIIYEAEEDTDQDQISLEKAMINIEERRQIRSQMEKLGEQQNALESELNQLRTLSISLRASKGFVFDWSVFCVTH